MSAFAGQGMVMREFWWFCGFTGDGGLLPFSA